MHDRDGKLIAKAVRSKNRLYKVQMELKETMCYLSTKTCESSLWHARLSQINMETMKSMIRRELVGGVPHIEVEKRIYGSCLLGKQARQSFPQSTLYLYLNLFMVICVDL